MLIEIKKFGVTLTSRQAGKEALSAYRPVLKDISKNENIIVDFEGINTFSPSWGDEFLTPLHELFKGKLFLKNSKNPSVIATISILEKTHHIQFARV